MRNRGSGYSVHPLVQLALVLLVGYVILNWQTIFPQNQTQVTGSAVSAQDAGMWSLLQDLILKNTSGNTTTQVDPNADARNQAISIAGQNGGVTVVQDNATPLPPGSNRVRILVAAPTGNLMVEIPKAGASTKMSQQTNLHVVATTMFSSYAVEQDQMTYRGLLPKGLGVNFEIARLIMDGEIPGTLSTISASGTGVIMYAFSGNDLVTSLAQPGAVERYYMIPGVKNDDGSDRKFATPTDAQAYLNSGAIQSGGDIKLNMGMLATIHVNLCPIAYVSPDISVSTIQEPNWLAKRAMGLWTTITGDSYDTVNTTNQTLRELNKVLVAQENKDKAYAPAIASLNPGGETYEEYVNVVRRLGFQEATFTFLITRVDIDCITGKPLGEVVQTAPTAP